ncbi:MAG: ZinT/AdcA family metal-binding protein [Lachnospiraceae bacterium]|nr:ZinT/AdcA family metal-binding protein [Lachnospiraceae bacterium]
MKKYISILLAAVMAVGCLAGCGQKNSNEQADNTDDGKLKVVTTIFPEYDWVKEIAGDEISNIDLTMLLDNGVDLHSYQPTSEDILKISDCDLFVYVGGESDSWVDDALKNATNKDMQVINLLDVLKDSIKTEESMPGMQAEEGHNHGYAHFEDSDVQDRTLSDWDGDWQSVYPYLQDGVLDEVMEKKAESGEKTAEEYKEYYENGYKTDVSQITIDAENNTMCFVKNGVASKATYEYKGYQIYDYESGSRGVRYFFEATSGDADAPKYVQFSDHGIAPGKAEHFHIYAGNDGFDALSEEMENWPTYYPADMSGKEIAEDMLEHEEKEYDEHVWLSLKNAQTLCKAIAEALETADPEHKDVYAANVDSYLEKLSSLDGQYQDAVANASQKTLLFGERFPFRYMVDDYGLKYYAAFAGCSAESEASFETISFLAKKVDELGLKNIMTIENSDQKIAKTIRDNTKDKNQEILSLDSMQSTTSEDVKNGTTYLSVMESNLDVLKKAMQ